jgi:alpha-galactosidase
MIERTGSGYVVEHGATRIDISVETGDLRLSERHTGDPVALGGWAVEFSDGRVLRSRETAWEADGPDAIAGVHGRGQRLLLHSAGDGWRLQLEIASYAEGFLLRVGLENLRREPLRVRSLTPFLAVDPGGGLSLNARPQDWRWFRHGWQSWTPAFSLSGAQQDIDARPPVHAPAAPLQGRGVLASEDVAVLLDPASGRSVLLGFVSARSQWAQVRLVAARHELLAVAFADDAVVREGETIWSEWLTMDVGSEPQPLLERYASALAREMHARVPVRPPAGWCSWYYYFTTVSEEDVLANLKFLSEHRRELPAQLVQIDDGYQTGIGDWTSIKGKFPHGMAWLAGQIRSAGFTAGLWLAPFLAGERSQLYAQHPDWLTLDADGEPALALHNWEQRCFGLDCTHPSVQAWLRELFRQVTDGWGYDYVKIDFLYGGALAGQRHDRDASRIQAYRRGLEAVREGVGKHRFILGCGALMASTVGLVDGQRIGPDVAPWWRFRRSRMTIERGRPKVGGEPATENAVRNILTRSWMHGRLWANDPDCLLARSARTKLTVPEVQSLATAIALSGGMMLVSDDLPQLTEERLELISGLLPPLGQAGRVPDLLTAAMPETIELEVTRPHETWQLVGRFNWSGRRRDIDVALPPGRWHAFDFWQERYLGIRTGTLRLTDVARHGVRLLALRRVLERPQLVGTTLHYSMGGAEVSDIRWDDRRRSLRIELQPVARSGGSVVVSVPAAYTLADARIDGSQVEARAWRHVVAVPVAVDRPSGLDLHFS